MSTLVKKKKKNLLCREQLLKKQITFERALSIKEANRMALKLLPFIKMADRTGNPAVLQIRRGNRDNLGIISHISP